MRYWLDTEFIESGAGRPIELLSIGIVAEDGRELYFENLEADISNANDFAKEHVLPQLEHQRHGIHMNEGHHPRCPARERTWIALGIQLFCDPGQYGRAEFWGYYADYDWVEFWGYYADYDWVVLCQLFGAMVDLPKRWPMYARDIKQWADELGNPPLPEQGKGEHHALADAKWNRQAWEFLAQYSRAHLQGFVDIGGPLT